MAEVAAKDADVATSSSAVAVVGGLEDDKDRIVVEIMQMYGRQQEKLNSTLHKQLQLEMVSGQGQAELGGTPVSWACAGRSHHLWMTSVVKAVDSPLVRVDSGQTYRRRHIISLHLVQMTPNHISLPFTTFKRADIIEWEKIVLYKHRICSRYGTHCCLYVS